MGVDARLLAFVIKLQEFPSLSLVALAVFVSLSFYSRALVRKISKN